MRRSLLPLICLLASIGVATPAQATGLPAPPLLWSIAAPGEPRVEGATGVVYSAGLLYVTSYAPNSGGSSLSILDASTHEFLGSVADASLDGAASLAVEGDYAYVTGVQNRVGLTNANRLTVVDVSDPAHPSVVGSVQDNTVLYGAYGVQAAGDLVYVAAQGCVTSVCKEPELGNRLVVVDVSDKTNPQVIGSVADPVEKTHHLDAIAVAGNRVYGTAFSSGALTVFDVTDPSQPTILGWLRSPLLADSNDVVVRGRYAYVIDQSLSNARLVVLDISDPAQPLAVGSVLDTTSLSEGYWLKLVGDHVFVAAAESDALTVVDVSDPTQPEVVATRSDPTTLGVADGIDVFGNTAYVAAFCTTPNSGCSNPTTGALSAFDVSAYTALDFTSGPLADDSSSRPSFSFTASEEGATYTCALDGAPAAPCTSPFLPSSPLAAGPHSLTVSTGTDATTWSWTLDAPTISSPISGSSGPSTTPVLKGIAGTRPGDIDSVSLALYSGTSASGSPVQTLGVASNPNSGAYTATVSPPLAPGTYTAQASQANTAGRTATSLPVTFTVLAPPDPQPSGEATSTGSAAGPSPARPNALSIATLGAPYVARQATVTLICSGPAGTKCQGTLRLSLPGAARGRRRAGARPIVIGSANYVLDAGSKGSVRVTLNRAGRSAMAHAARHRLRVQASATILGGSPLTAAVTLTAGT